MISHLIKVRRTQELPILDNYDPLLGLNEKMHSGDFEAKRTRERWAQVFSELGKMIFNGCMVVIWGLKLPLSGIRGIRVMRQFGRKQIVPPTRHRNIYVFDHGDGRVSNAGDIIKEWKNWLKRLLPKTGLILDMWMDTRLG